MEYSHQNHFRWGWDDKWFNPPGEKFQIQLGSCASQHEELRSEVRRALRLLADQFTKPVAIGLSGGSDSQAVCLSMLEERIDFTPLILQLEDDAGQVRNQHDIQAAFEFCRKWRLAPIVETLHMRQFYEGEGRRLMQKNYLSGKRTLIQLHLVEKYKDTHAFIMAGGDVTINRQWQLRATGFEELVTSFSPTPIQQHLIANEIEGCTKFFMYTPELIAAYLANPIVDGFVNGHQALFESLGYFEQGQEWQNQWRCWVYFVKPLLYAQQWPELIHRRKLHGFEDTGFDELARATLANVGYQGQQSVKLSIKHLRDHLLSGEGRTKIWTSDQPYLDLKPSLPAIELAKKLASQIRE